MAAPNIATVTDANFPQEVTACPTPVVLDFWAEWCGPCKMIAPILGELADEFDGRVKIGKVDVDQNQGLAVNYGITAIPTLVFLKGGQVVDQMRGARSKRDLKDAIERLCA